MTPAQRAGIPIQNSWTTLLEQTIRSRKNISPENQQAGLSP
ncbi:MAG: hypothetical protein ACRDF4_06725 [Rhabdochlamydiaceae bacterium]